MNRKDFIKANSILASGILLLGSQACNSTKKSTVKNTKLLVKINTKQQALPYAYNALENVIDAITMEIHYLKHAAAYSKNFEDAIKEEKINVDYYEQLFGTINLYSNKLRNNAGGHYNHELFWKLLQAPTNNNMPYNKLKDKIISKFGSFNAFKLQFSNAAKSQFGSGWAWLILDKNNELQIVATPNQDNPLMSPFVATSGMPLLALDVWEHAYYLKYQNKRADYIDNFWQIVNWNFVESRYTNFLK